MLLLPQKNFVLKGFKRLMKTTAESTRKGKAVESSNPRNTKMAEPRCWTGAHNRITRGHSPEVDYELEQRFQRLKCKLGNGVKAATYLKSFCNNGSSSSKKVLWADTAGFALTQVAFFSNDDFCSSTRPWAAPKSPKKDKHRSEEKQWTEVHCKKNRPLVSLDKKTYREALLSTAPPSPPRIPTFVSSKLDRLSFKGRCFRCLG